EGRHEAAAGAVGLGGKRTLDRVALAEGFQEALDLLVGWRRIAELTARATQDLFSADASFARRTVQFDIFRDQPFADLGMRFDVAGAFTVVLERATERGSSVTLFLLQPSKERWSRDPRDWIARVPIFSKSIDARICAQ